MTEKEFVGLWAGRLSDKKLKKFPEDFLGDGGAAARFEEMGLPGVNLLMGEELFGSYELIDLKGNSVYITQSFAKAKYLLYSNRNKPRAIRIPLEESSISSMVKQYEKHMDALVKEIEADYNLQFPKIKNFNAVSNEIFNSLNLKRF